MSVDGVRPGRQVSDIAGGSPALVEEKVDAVFHLFGQYGSHFANSFPAPADAVIGAPVLMSSYGQEHANRAFFALIRHFAIVRTPEIDLSVRPVNLSCA